MPPSSVLIVGASRGLGLALATHYAALIGPSNVFCTVRSPPKPGQSQLPDGVQVITGVDLGEDGAGETVVRGLGGRTVQYVFVVAGLLESEKLGTASWSAQLAMYAICAISPVLLVQSLHTASALAPGAKILLITSEAGSLTLRTPGEGGGMYGHHGSKAAANMAGRLLAWDLAAAGPGQGKGEGQGEGVVLAMVHPGFLKTEMTRGAGMEAFYEEMGAVEPEEACGPLAEFAEGLGMEGAGKLWAPMGAKGIGNAVEVMGEWVKEHKGPLELPW